MMHTRIAVLFVLSFLSGCGSLAPSSPTDSCESKVKPTEILSSGSDSIDFWENTLSGVRARFAADSLAVQEFLKDWKPGETYTLIDVVCFENHSPRIIFDLKFATPRLGTAIMSAERTSEGVVALSLFLSGLDNVFE